MSAMAKAAPRTKQSKCPAPKELLKQRIEYKLSSNDDDVMEWHGGVVKKKYKAKPGWYSCALDDGTAVVLQPRQCMAHREPAGGEADCIRYCAELASCKPFCGSEAVG